MNKKILFHILLLLTTTVAISQDFSALWEGHFSYLNITDVSQGNDKLYASAENAVFTYDLTSNEIEKISTINGLSGETISAIHYSEIHALLIIGYENGLIEIVSDADDDILTVVDIIDKETIPPSNKRINHFNEYNDLLYISTDYGISVYDLNRLEFGDTYFIGNLGTQKIVFQTTVFNDHIYVASPTGIQKALVNSTDLIDYNQWQTINPFYWVAIATVGDKLYAIRRNRALNEIINDSFNTVFTYATIPVDMKSADGKLIVTTEDNIYVYDSDFTLLDSASLNASFDTKFTCGIIDPNDNIYIGTEQFSTLR